MFDKESTSPFLHTKLTAEGGSFSTEILADPVQQYNYVIHYYNIDENRVNGIQLDPIIESKIYRLFWKVFSNSWMMLVFLGMIMVPGLGCLFYIWLSAAIVFYLGAMKIFDSNQKKVADPFENMVFSPELCRATDTPNKFYELRVEELEGFSFNPEVVAKLKLRQDQDEVKFMVYDGRFWDYYHGLTKFKARFVLIWILASMLLMIQLIFIKALVEAHSDTL